MADRPSGRGRKVFAPVKGTERLAGFVAYNPWHRAAGGERSTQDASSKLDKAAVCPPVIPLLCAIPTLEPGAWAPCCSNLAISGQQALDRVHLEDPVSEPVLGCGQAAEASTRIYLAASFPWNILVDREPTDGAAVQEVHSCRTACVRHREASRRAAIG